MWSGNTFGNHFTYILIQFFSHHSFCAISYVTVDGMVRYFFKSLNISIKKKKSVLGCAEGWVMKLPQTWTVQCTQIVEQCIILKKTSDQDKAKKLKHTSAKLNFFQASHSGVT